MPVRDFVRTGPSQPARLSGFDQGLLWVTVGLLALGLVMVYSATVALPDNPRFARYTPTYFLVRHLASLGIGFVAALLVVQVPIAQWEKWAPYLFIASLLGLVVVLIPHVGLSVNGARRWIPLGIMNFQPSEAAKVGIAMYAASYMVRKMDIKERFFKAVLPMAVALALIGVLLLAEPDMGAFIVIATVALGILFLGGVNGRMFFLSVAVLVGAFVLMIVFSEFRRQRIFAYLDPWDEKYAQGKAYQLTHSLIAIGRGEITGQGLGNSVEKLHYLPEAHTDFLLAVVGEELGFIGVAVVIFAFFWLARRIFHIGRQAIALDRVFAGLMTQGIGIWMGGQAFINMGVNLGLLPTKGLTLPLMSYGGSAILMNLVALAIVLRVDMENRQLMKGGRT
ncbi:putative lipid II flippase FtsW [Azohydromonas lata]|uniref:Probable peptidoglycan glycosyltransferase FtsW n=1 Tax=Azohydromonas lata TaxID=45677 RepID=A0ABU5I978_9BURK|nr:putative lipid II flippase FtsW [Azohydromonas lata]MDZ5455513.1 putative lipid II flippase FtsW [Azohydromonas lata]